MRKYLLKCILCAGALLCITNCFAAPPVITTQPTNQTTIENGSATFSIQATGDNLTYQWYVSLDDEFIALTNSDGIITGATTNSLTISGLTLDNSNVTLFCVVKSDKDSTISDNATLTVTLKKSSTLSIIKQPTAQAIQLGSNATFSVEASGTGSLKYQWYYLDSDNEVNSLDNDELTSGANTSNLTLSRLDNISDDSIGSIMIFCVVTDNNGNKSTDTVTFTVSKKETSTINATSNNFLLLATGNTIYVNATTSEAMDVKLYTLNGILMDQKSPKNGICQFSVPQNGIYIIKVGDKSKKILIE